MTATHTPGPWYVTDDNAYKVFKDVGDYAHMIATCGNWSEETCANARLIAAAPELLAALERSERKLSAYVGVCTGDKELTKSILPSARAAIAKARGI